MTYEELQLAWKRELQSSDLQPLRQGFFKDLSSYVKRLREAQQNLDTKSLRAALIEDELLRIEQLLTQLLNRRADKLWSQEKTLQASDLETVEKQAEQTLSDIHREYDKIRQSIIQGREPTAQISNNRGLVLVRFEKDAPSIMGVDLKVHGPFHKEDIANIPRENAESLIRRGTAQEITTPNRNNE